ncbi:MAG: hypothetical protein NXI20_02835 [bacterium]|nr:hypothetical protein [bacterium]
MTRQLILIIALILSSSASFSQIGLQSYNIERQSINRKGMLTLGSWAIVNIVSSPILASSSEGSEKYFHQMNGYWNGVNLIIAGFGYYGATRDHSTYSLTKSIKAQNNIERALVFNSGLDLAYIASGLYLRERSKNTSKNGDRLKGFGKSLILQGAFLFTFDITMFLIHSSHSKKLMSQIDRLAFSGNGISLHMRF